MKILKFICPFLYMVVFLFSYSDGISTLKDSNKIYCQKDSDCIEGRICIEKKCECKDNHISNGISCLPEALYGEQCVFDEQCLDHRQFCLEQDDGIKRCFCDRFHIYDTEYKYCTPKKNITDMLYTEHHHAEEIQKQARSTFFGILIGGMVVTALGFISLAVCFVYCFRIHSMDSKLDKTVKKLESQQSTRRQTIKRKEEKNPAVEASIGPIMLDDVVIG